MMMIQSACNSMQPWFSPSVLGSEGDGDDNDDDDVNVNDDDDENDNDLSCSLTYRDL